MSQVTGRSFARWKAEVVAARDSVLGDLKRVLDQLGAAAGQCEREDPHRQAMEDLLADGSAVERILREDYQDERAVRWLLELCLRARVLKNCAEAHSEWEDCRLLAASAARLVPDSWDPLLNGLGVRVYSVLDERAQRIAALEERCERCRAGEREARAKLESAWRDAEVLSRRTEGYRAAEREARGELQSAREKSDRLAARNAELKEQLAVTRLWLMLASLLALAAVCAFIIRWVLP